MLANHYVSLQTATNSMGGRKVEDGKEEEQRKKKVKYHVNSILLNNNEIRDIKSFYDTLYWVLPSSNPN